MGTGNLSAHSPAEPRDTNKIELVSIKDSHISGVRVYPANAEVTRVFRFDVKAGQNHISITGLPKCIVADSLRVQGYGTATIHDVAIAEPDSRQARSRVRAATSPKLTELTRAWNKTVKSLYRVEKTLNAMETFVGSIRAEAVDTSKVEDIVNHFETYQAAAAKLDDKISQLEEEKQRLANEIKEEKMALRGPDTDQQLTQKATIGIYAETDGELELILTYTVCDATWSAVYDIHVDSQAKGRVLTLLYKASIIQYTGEDWVGSAIKLETMSPASGATLPTLSRWSLRSLQFPTIQPACQIIGPSPSRSRSPRAYSLPVIVRGSPVVSPPAITLPPRSVGERSPSPPPPPMIMFRGSQVSRQGNISATFDIEGRLTIPSDNIAHSVKIVELKLNGDLEFVVVPKRDTRVHIKAKIKNESAYTLLEGPASVYIDGTFSTRSKVPLTSPEETFDCHLGLDESIRVTYPTASRNKTETGFVTKSCVTRFTQHLTVHNTKPRAISHLKVVEQIPVSEEASIVVKLLNPPLPLLNLGEANHEAAFSKAPAQVPVSEGVVAQWGWTSREGSDGVAYVLHSDQGGLWWKCDIPAHGKVNLMLQWEVTAPWKTVVSGL